MENTLQAGMAGPIQILLFLFLIAFLVFWIKTIIEISNSTFVDNSKTTWFLLVILLGWIGLIVYYASGRAKRVTEVDDYSDIIDGE